MSDSPSTDRSHFDGDAYLEAMALPRLTLGGRTVVGRLLSFDEWTAFSERLTAAGAGVSGNRVTDLRRFRALIVDLTRRIYGRGRPWWQVWRPTVTQLLLVAPLPVQVEALRRFCESQSEKFAVDAERLRAMAGTPTSQTP